MRTFLALSLLVFGLTALSAQITPDISSWIQNTTGQTGYNGILSNVQLVQYSTDNVYVSCTCIPGYDIGPWAGNPNIPANQNFVFKITRHPVANTGTATVTGLGHIGVWTNGVSIFNPKDGMSYQNQHVWNQNAIVVEGASFDNCLGHPAPNGEYHHHLNPGCLYDDSDPSQHSPLIGFAFDGFPIYGAYGFANPDGSGGIKRMNGSYRLRDITQRTTLPDGSPAASAGPAISATRPLGYYVEDFEFVPGLGELDEHNGRFCVTPDYPDGHYCYFVTIDDALNGVYPYVVGPQYYGTVQAGNTGPGSGHNTPNESVATYTVTGLAETFKEEEVEVFPNPASDYLNLQVASAAAANYRINLSEASGRMVLSAENLQPGNPYAIDLQRLPAGLYFLRIEGGAKQALRKITLVR